jgi:hypothetical protein
MQILNLGPKTSLSPKFFHQAVLRQQANRVHYNKNDFRDGWYFWAEAAPGWAKKEPPLQCPVKQAASEDDIQRQLQPDRLY